jgi:hypothetical protein
MSRVLAEKGRQKYSRSLEEKTRREEEKEGTMGAGTGMIFHDDSS